jgi:hypothetical protein
MTMSAGQSGGMQMFAVKQEIKAAMHKTLADLQPQLSAKCGLSPTELSTAMGYALVEAGVEVLTKPLNASYAEKHEMFRHVGYLINGFMMDRGIAGGHIE